METGNSDKNLKSLGWDTLEERRLKDKVITFHKARLKLIDVDIEHLSFKKRSTRLGGGELAYNRPNSAIDSHRFSFFPSTTNLWNHLPATIKSCEDINNFTSSIKKTNLTSIKYNMSAV